MFLQTEYLAIDCFNKILFYCFIFLFYFILFIYLFFIFFIFFFFFLIKNKQTENDIQFKSYDIKLII